METSSKHLSGLLIDITKIEFNGSRGKVLGGWRRDRLKSHAETSHDGEPGEFKALSLEQVIRDVNSGISRGGGRAASIMKSLSACGNGICVHPTLQPSKRWDNLAVLATVSNNYSHLC